MIPNFDSNDTLPPGIYTVTWQEFCDRYGYTKHRRELLAGLEKGMNHLREAIPFRLIGILRYNFSNMVKYVVNGILFKWFFIV